MCMYYKIFLFYLGDEMWYSFVMCIGFGCGLMCSIPSDFPKIMYLKEYNGSQIDRIIPT